MRQFRIKIFYFLRRHKIAINMEIRFPEGGGGVAISVDSDFIVVNTRQSHFKRVQNVDDVAVDHPGRWYCRNVKRDVVRIGVFINGLFYFYYDFFVLTRLFRRVIRHHL